MAEFVTYYEFEKAMEDDEDFKASALELLNKVDDESTHTGASAVSELLNYWSTERELAVYDRGRVVDDILHCYVTTENPKLYAKATRVLYKSLKFNVQELTEKLKTEGFNTPAFLLPSQSSRQAVEPQAEALGDDERSPSQDGRQSQLYVFIWRVHQALTKQNKPTAQQLWREIQINHATYDTDKIIQEVDGERILWCSGYGYEQKLQRTSFNKTLSKIRKNPPI